MSRLVFFLEERSARVMLETLLARLMPELPFLCIDFQGKQQFEKELPKRLRAWNVPGDRFIAVRDQDSDDCLVLKNRIRRLCQDAHKPDVIVRIACRELESWYLGEFAAVEAAMNTTGLVGLENKARYRDPDSIVNPATELEQLTDGQYQKIDGSRRIARFLDPMQNRSASFQVLWKRIQSIAEEIMA